MKLESGEAKPTNPPKQYPQSGKGRGESVSSAGAIISLVPLIRIHGAYQPRMLLDQKAAPQAYYGL